ncbi:E3 ubiquitin-protein ligase RFWD2 [Apostasia shenzhenica]|uniref:E3 ubiquitin-protein ligase RFWD2 n=1 Tax=Apostasia shenzhenica TaxID=1088818 RepID=A0A2I0A244_9ASPA|nr:E3 ubiquitin-protein ligase RFWD2 [Apostasia shenzhenica]
MEGDGIGRSRMTLLDQISVMEPSNLRDLLKVGQDDDASVAGVPSVGRAVTLASILESEKHSGRTLLDIIQEEDESLGDALPESSDSTGGGTPPEREEEQPARVSLMALLALTEGGQDEYAAAASDSAGRGMMATESEEEEEEEEIAGSVAAADDRVMCCVCMARKKGAAFIPCGHTFCRVCSRELWTGRGTCPLCNGFILDILDIF